MSAANRLADAEALERAAAILLRDSTHKRSIWLAVIRRLLIGHAAKLRRRT